MPLLALLIVALNVGCAVTLIVWRYPRTPTSAEAAHTLGEAVATRPFLRALLAARLDPATVTGLALTLALGFVIGGGLLLGVLAYLVRTNSHLIGIDNSVAKWGNGHASALSTHGLDLVTQLGSIYMVLALCLVLAVVETMRTRSIWIIPFIIVVVGGEELLTNTIKQLADRIRPAFNPAAATLGPSFPSGHSATAAAFYAAAALLLSRQRLRPTRAILAGLAAGIAVAVAASRVLLDVHWLSDVIAGLALGWAWLAVCAIAFGGRLLRFGATADAVARTAKAESSPGSSEAGPGQTFGSWKAPDTTRTGRSAN
jgi:undecaprenyl-diphosphatase